MPMTAAQILQKTPAVVRGRSVGIRLSKLVPKFANLKGVKVPVLRATAKSPESKNSHVCTVAAIEAKPLSEAKIVVDCECEFFTFNCEWALAQKGAAVITRSNGEPPDAKNPKYVPMCCKHLVTLLDQIVTKKM